MSSRISPGKSERHTSGQQVCTSRRASNARFHAKNAAAWFSWNAWNAMNLPQQGVIGSV
jgi:hypothetical protein